MEESVMKLKKALTAIFILAFTFSAAACGSSPSPQTAERTKIKVGIVGETEKEFWAPVIATLAEDGIDVEIISFGEYTLPNAALDEGEIDLNAFQHYAYLGEEIKNHGYKIEAICDTYISAMCIYSDKIKDISELKAGDKIAIPSDAVNLGRALSVAQGAGIIKLDTPEGGTNEISNISSNPLNIEFVQVDAAQVPTLLPDVAAGIINCSYAVDYGFSPLNDSIFYDDVSFYTDKRYVNNIVARTADADNEVFKKVVAAYQSEAVEEVYKDKFEGAYFPCWK